jgi:hypothetical protein
MSDGRTGKMLVGFAVLHVLCCGLPLLFAAGAFGGVGALLGSPALLAAGAAAAVVALALGAGRARRARGADCCRAEDLGGQTEIPRLSAASRTS